MRKEFAMKSIVEVLGEEGSFQTLLEMLGSSGLAERLQSGGPFTLFAPDDAAFEKVDLTEIVTSPEKLVETLEYHIVEGCLSSEDLRSLDCAATLCGKSLAVKVRHGELVADNGRLVRTDITCANGIIHVIDSVFLPHLSGWYGDCGCC